jgi:hypothetical protein
MSFFFFYKIREQESGTGPVYRVGTSGKGKDVEKGCRRVNIVQILFTHVCKWKMTPVETIPGMEGGIKENGGGGEFKYGIFDIL